MSKRVMVGVALFAFLGFFGDLFFHVLFGFLGSVLYTLFIGGLGFYGGRKMAHYERRRELQ